MADRKNRWGHFGSALAFSPSLGIGPILLVPIISLSPENKPSLNPRVSWFASLSVSLPCGSAGLGM